MRYILLFFICSFSGFCNTIEIEINQKKYTPNYAGTIEILAKEKTLNIEISAPNEISYILENQDIDWTLIKNNNSFSYNNLSGGEYFLKLKNKEKVIANLKLKVALPFFRTWYFWATIYFFLVIILSMIIYLFLLYKFRQQAKLQTVRTNIAADLHDDVGATLTSIGFFGELIRQKIINRAEPAEILPLLSKVIDSSKESVETMRGVVWTINPNNDLAKDFFEKLRYYASEMLSTKGVDLDFKTSGVINQELGIDVQRNLFLFFKEAINNILKHAQAKKTQVNIEIDGRRFKMNINDDGKGFDTFLNYDGHGLMSLKNRIEILDGNLKISSIANQGTQIDVSIILP